MRDPQIVLAATFDNLFIYLFLFLILASVSLGTEKKNAPANRYGATNSVKNIEGWKLGDDAKQV